MILHRCRSAGSRMVRPYSDSDESQWPQLQPRACHAAPPQGCTVTRPCKGPRLAVAAAAVLLACEERGVRFILFPPSRAVTGKPQAGHRMRGPCWPLSGSGAGGHARDGRCPLEACWGNASHSGSLSGCAAGPPLPLSCYISCAHSGRLAVAGRWPGQVVAASNVLTPVLGSSDE
jgi:hypothetical protein